MPQLKSAVTSLAGLVRPRVLVIVSLLLFGLQMTAAAQQMSTICRFTSGPLAGTTRDYAPRPPIPVGSSCTDGVYSWGVVIPRASPPNPGPAQTSAGGSTFIFNDGSKKKCTTYGGQIAEQVYLPAAAAVFNQGYTGVTVARPDGSAKITWDTSRLNSLPPEAHDFIFFHECAHAHVPTSDELVANCVGLIDMRAANRSSAAIEQRLAQFHAGLGYMGPRYGNGAEYWAKTVQCAANGAPQAQLSNTSLGTTTTCRFTVGPRAGQVIDFGNRPGVVPAMIGAPCSDGRGSYGTAVASAP